MKPDDTDHDDGNEGGGSVGSGKKRLPWHKISDKFVRKQKLPHGTKIILLHPKKRGTKERQARQDRRFTLSTWHGYARDDETINEMILYRLIPSLGEDPTKSGLIIKVMSPQKLWAGPNTKLGTAREWEPLPTEEQLQAADEIELEIQDVADSFDYHYQQLEYGRTTDEPVVLRGIVRGLLGHFSAEELADAFKLEKSAA